MYHIAIVKCKLVRSSFQKNSIMIVRSPKDAADTVRKYLSGEDREHLVVLLLDNQNKIAGIHTVSVGTIDQTIAAPREIFKAAILCNAVGIIMAHNHPTDKIDPSVEDHQRVREMAEAGELMGIKLMDALIVSDETDAFFSFKEKAPYDLG